MSLPCHCVSLRVTHGAFCVVSTVRDCSLSVIKDWVGMLSSLLRDQTESKCMGVPSISKIPTLQIRFAGPMAKVKKVKAPPHELEVKGSGKESKEDKPKVDKPDKAKDRKVSQKENVNSNAGSKEASSSKEVSEPSNRRTEKPQKDTKEKKAKVGEGETKEDKKKAEETGSPKGEETKEGSSKGASSSKEELGSSESKKTD